eukprot:CAMPEP_0115451236 /NCGR_PEP_ID=MMETSP0271-20121206/41956_1 /TAXON_ID=71861 /ORGANISM="Scrippsiella trochoidea, Strain CCMP3099" /LENGTH=63 /DNA_ID=CAMNT_0002877489 /DNA_START=376 /DNA_END=567 /DNA_ORIENTATION=-
MSPSSHYRPQGFAASGPDGGDAADHAGEADDDIKGLSIELVGVLIVAARVQVVGGDESRDGCL